MRKKMCTYGTECEREAEFWAWSQYGSYRVWYCGRCKKNREALKTLEPVAFEAVESPQL